MRIAVIDDLQADRQTLCSLIQQFFTEDRRPLTLEEYDSSEQFWESFSRGAYDFVFLDIFMDGMNGMETGRLLYQSDPDCRIIFLTTSPDFAIQGYEVRAFRYLLKPISQRILFPLLQECVMLSRQYHRRLLVRMNREDVEIPYSQIQYALISGRNTEFHLTEKVVTISSHFPFAQLVAPLLEDRRFVICNRGIVVNLEYVNRLTDESFLMSSGDTVSISRREYAKARKRYLEFSFADF